MDFLNINGLTFPGSGQGGIGGTYIILTRVQRPNPVRMQEGYPSLPLVLAGHKCYQAHRFTRINSGQLPN